ncbi:arsenic metallochaperone ArsD family protein [Enterococcus mundtii]|uniref:arsenic metallochaperone ArsD family protein n=1 Tax=Enterococcus mundtii TaxID=53346 RepID=UPI002DBAE193|nr:arsenic metallochaperone ArsD family protein [Enterococcus mundtii]MEC3941382.1 arsenic metallochaperone ArsD family protein [Enterococcus mundtii]
MIISYYVFEQVDDEELYVFKSLHEDLATKEFYSHTKGKKLETILYFLSHSILPFLENSQVLNLLRTGDIKRLPIIEIDNQIVKTGSYLSLTELSEITGIGISMQRTDYLT